MSPIRVLVADDHPLLREGIAAVLTAQADIELVGEAGDGQEALDCFRRLRPDVTLMDLQMPRLDGAGATAIAEALMRLIAAGAQVQAFPDDVLAAAFAESRKLYAEYAEGNENFRKIYEHWSAYWQKQQQWLRVAELPYDYFTSGQVGR